MLIIILSNSGIILLVNKYYGSMGIDVIKLNKKEQKRDARRLRKEGFSYSEIQKKVPVAKSTLSLWLKNTKLTAGQINRLKKKRLEAAARGAEKRKSETARIDQRVRDSSIRDIKKISKRELWLMGIMLYWRERMTNQNQEDIKKGVRFISSDPDVIKLFLKWLHDVGGLKKEDISFDVFIGKNKKKKLREIKDYWAKTTGSNIKDFSRVYLQKTRLKITKRKTTRANYGFLRIRVKSSSMLARQISGWIAGVKQEIGF
ncbi:MAG: hypothetical protein WED06_02310 [Candidatus Paceibacterota bacterium]